MTRKSKVFKCVILIVMLIYLSCNKNGGFENKKLIGHVRPKKSGEINKSPWGIQLGTSDEKLLDKAADIGIKWTRLSASWQNIEHKKGRYDWSETDKIFNAVIKKGITPFVCISNGNEHYCEVLPMETEKLTEIYGLRPAPPTSSDNAMKAWLSFVKNLVQRYKDRITYWEIWNEPNHFSFWRPEPNPKEYGRLLVETAKLIKTIDPDAVIIGGSTAGIDLDFIKGFLNTESTSIIDKITIHNYGTIPEKRIYQAIPLLEMVKKYNSDIEVWQGECGHPSESNTTGFRGESPWGFNIQSKWLLRQAFTDIFFCGFKISTYFKLVDQGEPDAIQERLFLSEIDSLLGYPERDGKSVRKVGVNEKCLLKNPDLIPKPAYDAYQNLCALFDGKYQPTKISYKLKIREEGNFYGIGPAEDVFPSVPLVASFKTNDDSYLIAYWLPWHPQEFIQHPAKIDIVFKNMNFIDPILVDLLFGKIYHLNSAKKKVDKVKFKDIPLFDYPIIIMEKAKIEFDS